MCPNVTRRHYPGVQQDSWRGFGNLDRIYSISNSFSTPLLDPGSRMEAWWGLKSFKKDLFLLGLDPWRPIRKLFTFFKITCEGIVLELRNVISANINIHIAVILSPMWSLYDLQKQRYGFQTCARTHMTKYGHFRPLRQMGKTGKVVKSIQEVKISLFRPKIFVLYFVHI